MLSFKLREDIVKDIASKKVPWGFTSGPNLTVGELTYVRTYSAKKGDESKERWHETCRRTVEGAFSIQKNHVQLHLNATWDEDKAQRSAAEMFNRMYHFKFWPPGRGLENMGTQGVNGWGYADRLYNCFTGDVEILTSEGVKPLRELAEENWIEVAWDGRYQKAEVHHFGKQPTQLVRLSPTGMRSNHVLEYQVTPDHRWILSDSTETTNLSVGDRITAHSENTPHYDDVGVAHGLVFGDGTRNKQYPDRHMIRLCSDRDKGQLKLLQSIPGYKTTSFIGDDPYVNITRKGENWKSVPEPDSLPSYIAGFIKGWLIADGCTNKSGTVCLDTINVEAAEWLKANAYYAGYTVVGHSVDNNNTNYGPRNYPLQRIKLSPNKDITFTVREIIPSDTRDVYCAVVKSTGAFILSGGLITGNCAFVSTLDKTNPTRPYASLMSKSMRGVGVGFDTEGTQMGLQLRNPKGRFYYPIPDTTEGWVESTEAILKAFFHGNALPHFSYDRIRRQGSLINSGGVAPGPGPLVDLHKKLTEVLSSRTGQVLDSRTIVDIANLEGKGVVSGGKRRTALLALGKHNDDVFTNLKNFNLPENAERMSRDGWAWSSNNSLKVHSNLDIDFEAYAEQQLQREPGLFVEDLVQNYGRLVDGFGHIIDKATGTNPCGEISLEDGETCNLVSINLMAQTSLNDFLDTIKYAYLYAKSVTLMPTSWPDTNYVSMRNRRIGCSVSGVAEFVEKYGWARLRSWLEKGYTRIRQWDKLYSEWLCVRESIKVTTVKPEGTAALLSASTPGVHYPVARNYIRRMRFSVTDPLLEVLSDAGYRVEPDNDNPKYTMVVELPTQGAQIRDEQEVSVYEKLGLATLLQEVWSDNQVSFTLTFDKDKPQDLASALKMNWGRYKSISCSPIYEVEDAQQARDMQLPYQGITEEEFQKAISKLKPVDLERVYRSEGKEAEGDRFCDSDRCII